MRSFPSIIGLEPEDRTRIIKLGAGKGTRTEVLCKGTP